MKFPLRVTLSLVVLLCLNCGAASAAGFYVDSGKGSDANTGRGPEAPWRTLGALNRIVFKPGDRILLAAGSNFTGQLAPRGSGNRNAPITIDVYGGNRKARIDAQGQVEAALLLRNVEHSRTRTPHRVNGAMEFLSRLRTAVPCTTSISRICISMMSADHSKKTIGRRALASCGRTGVTRRKAGLMA